MAYLARFPCLEELIVNDCRGNGDVRICSNSLECISSTHMYDRMFVVEFDVPKISKLKILDYCVPVLCFKTTSKEWEFDVFIGGFQKAGTASRWSCGVLCA